MSHIKHMKIASQPSKICVSNSSCHTMKTGTKFSKEYNILSPSWSGHLHRESKEAESNYVRDGLNPEIHPKIWMQEYTGLSINCGGPLSLIYLLSIFCSEP